MGEVRTFETGATRDTDQGKPDYRGFLSPEVLRRFGQYMSKHRVQTDGSLRDSDNWKKGIPQKAYLSSLLRHVVDLWYDLENPKQQGAPGVAEEIEELLCAVLFNTQGLLHERLLGRDTGKNGPYYPGSLDKEVGLGREPEWERFRYKDCLREQLERSITLARERIADAEAKLAKIPRTETEPGAHP